MTYDEDFLTGCRIARDVLEMPEFAESRPTDAELVGKLSQALSDCLCVLCEECSTKWHCVPRAKGLLVEIGDRWAEEK